MCVIVHQEADQHLKKKLCKELWQTNPDGGGFAYLDADKNLQVEKFMDFPTFWKRFETMRSANSETDFLLHMRIATHGSITEANVHPFRVDEHTVMAHNGILHGVADDLEAVAGDDRTDSQFFADEVLKDMPETWLDNPYLVDMVEQWLGWSKLMFITNNPRLKHSVYRLGDWDEEDGIKLSNLHHWLEPEPTGWEAVNTGYTESSEDWDKWYAYQSQRDQDRPMTEWELDMLLEGLRGERWQMDILHPIILIDEASAQLECGGCLEVIDIDTAECQCWDKVCLGCMQFVAACELTKECGINQMTEYDNMEPGAQDEIMGIPTGVDLRLVPEGAGNTVESMQVPF